MARLIDKNGLNIEVTDIEEGKSAGPDRKTFIYVNNRLEGNARETIDAMLDPAAS
jgi:hypothetical protein